MRKTKKIKIKYLDIDKYNLGNSKMSISCDYPKFDIEKKLYLYEILYYECLKQAIDEYQLNIYKNTFTTSSMFTSMFIELDMPSFSEIKPIFESESDLEKTKWIDDVQLLKIRIDMCKKHPKFWDV